MSSDSSAGGLPPGFSHLSGRYLSDQDLTTAMHHLARTAHQVVLTAAGAVISMLCENGTGHAIASTNTMVASTETTQVELGMGPSQDAWTTGRSQRIDDTTTDPRWAQWQAAAAETGIRSVLSTPMACFDRRLGALTVYATTPGAFGGPEVRVLELLADAAATLLGAAEPLQTPVHRSSPWEKTLGSQELMGLAVGVLMTRDQLSPETARAALVEAADTQERGLAEIATAVTDTTVGQEQARRLQATMSTACINRPDLWLRHFSLGGNLTEFEIDAYLHQALSLPQFQRDQLAEAANDILEQSAPPRASYTCEVLAGLTPSPNTDRQHDGTTRVAQTEATDLNTPGPCPENP